MYRRQVKLQWFVGEDDWQESGASTAGALTAGMGKQGAQRVDAPANMLGEHRLLLRVLRSGIIVCFIFILACGAAITRGEHENLQTMAELQTVSELELQALRTDDRELRDSLLDNRLALVEMQGWLSLHRVRRSQRYGIEVEIVDLDVQGDRAVALARVDPPKTHWVPVSYTETRFYQQDGSSWLRTVPPPDFWGERRVLETEHLRFEFFERDTAAVQAIADEMESTYLRVYELFGATPYPSRHKLTFLIEPRVVGRWSSSGVRVEVASPSLYRMPADASSSDQLGSTVTMHLISRALSDALQTTELYFLPQWYNVLIGVRDWAAADVMGRPSYLHAAAEDFWRQQHEQFWPLQLDDLSEQGQIDSDHRLARYLVSESLIAYAVETYGVETVPVLVHSLPHHDSWEDLITDVYDTSAEEFMDGWNGYLAEKYQRDRYSSAR